MALWSVVHRQTRLLKWVSNSSPSSRGCVQLDAAPAQATFCSEQLTPRCGRARQAIHAQWSRAGTRNHPHHRGTAVLRAAPEKRPPHVKTPQHNPDIVRAPHSKHQLPVWLDMLVSVERHNPCREGSTQCRQSIAQGTQVVQGYSCAHAADRVVLWSREPGQRDTHTRTVAASAAYFNGPSVIDVPHLSLCC